MLVRSGSGLPPNDSKVLRPITMVLPSVCRRNHFMSAGNFHGRRFSTPMRRLSSIAQIRERIGGCLLLTVHPHEFVGGPPFYTARVQVPFRVRAELCGINKVWELR